MSETDRKQVPVPDPGSPRPGSPTAADDAWWRSAAIYQLYVRSFADGNGDGIGDLAGVRAHLPYLVGLGIDAIWFNPWYPSPMSDAGYDISDYRDIDPLFGTLADADALIGEAHADGIRIDSAALLSKDAALPEVDSDQPPGPTHPYSDRDEVHDIYRAWRAVANEYPGRVLVGEIWMPDAARLARYVSPGELHTVFNFPYLACPWDAGKFREVIDQTLALNAPQGAPATWVLSNHDVDRIVSRYGRADTAFGLRQRQYLHSLPAGLALGTRRARAAALPTIPLPAPRSSYHSQDPSP